MCVVDFWAGFDQETDDPDNLSRKAKVRRIHIVYDVNAILER